MRSQNFQSESLKSKSPNFRLLDLRLLGLFFVGLLVLFGLYAYFGRQESTPPKIQVTPASHDFGAVSDQPVTHTFIVKNTGGSALKIENVSTSCGCTKAAIEQELIPPSQQTLLKVTFDPIAHGSEGREAFHIVYIKSNDPKYPEVEVEIRATLVLIPAEQPKEKEPSTESQKADTGREVVIYYNEACHDCIEYINHELIPLLRELGVQLIIKKDFINERKHRAELNERSAKLNIPPKLQGHLTVFLEDRHGRSVILQGHVPTQIIRDLLKPENEALYEKILVYQDKMTSHGKVPTDYKVWAFKGDVKTYSLNIPISEYLNWFSANREKLGEPTSELWEHRQLLPFVLLTGLLDGVNPCAFAVLLFFIAFLFTIRRSWLEVFKVGIVYIAAVYVTYFAIGLGILKAFVLSDQPHLMAKIGSWMVIALGLVNIKDYFWFGRWFSLGVLKVGQEARRRWMEQATLPAAAVVGFLVGLCEFPCTGGVYVAALGLLSTKTTALTGLAYLLLYNLMFVLPLIIILLFMSNRRVVGRLSRWEAANAPVLKLGQGLAMIALGAVILIWFV